MRLAVIFIMLLSNVAWADETTCTVLGDTVTCRDNRGWEGFDVQSYELRKQEIELAKQKALLEQQRLERLRLENELLRRQLAQAPSQERTVASINTQDEIAANPAFRQWQADNSWYGRENAKTEFAVLFARQLRNDRPDLTGRPFLDAVSEKIDQVFLSEP